MSAPFTVTTAPDGRLLTNLGSEGWGPWPFSLLSEPELSSELSRFANAKTSNASGVRVDSITFQPAQGEKNCSQDRIYDGPFNGLKWHGSMIGVFDGHAGEECADHTLAHFPSHLEQALASDPNELSAAISNAFVTFDDAITSQVLAIFPDPEALSSKSPEELSTIVNDQASGGANYEKIILSMRGTTALVALVHEERNDLWVAGVGDCRAVLGIQKPNGSWEARDLIAPQNGGNPVEMQKIRDAHPGEPDVTLKNRVLGAIAITRAFGDTEFKLPAAYTNQVFLRATPGFRVHSAVEDFTKRNLTPPYLSAVPDVVHVGLGASTDSDGIPRFVILMSDGAVDESLVNIRGETEAQSFQKWVELVGSRLDAESAKQGGSKETSEDNLAMAVLREVYGGANQEHLSAFLTVEMEEKWVDDTSIQVVVF
ncbi:protein serine/threonine phosphatase 2C [Ceratobasidium sp. AG-I]|nr:protein serine/threonine phosphatase 2C [Ceratobasidium sp. AG-I]